MTLFPTTRRERSIRRRRAGFTLVELMMAMIAGSFVIASGYYIINVTTLALNQQMSVSETQMSLRSALDLLRRDLTRAGYLTSANTGQLPGSCDPSSESLPVGWPWPSLRIEPDEVAQRAPLLIGPNRTRGDRVTLLGAYRSNDMFLLDAGLSNPTTVVLQNSWETFRRAFVDPPIDGQPPPPGINRERFNQTFRSEAWVRLESEGRFYFRQLQDVSPDTNSMVVSPPLPPCFKFEGAMVAPISAVQYALEPLMLSGTPLPELARLAPTVEGPGVERLVLVRREVDPQNIDRPIDGTTRVVIDYAVEFVVDGSLNIAPPGTPAQWQRIGPDGNPSLTTRDVELQMRALHVSLSARNPEYDNRIAPMPRANLSDPLMTFELPPFEGMVAHTRVRTMRTEVVLRNFGLTGLN